MTSLTPSTDVFAHDAGERCAVVFLARLRRGLPLTRRRELGNRVAAELARLAAVGWDVSVPHMFGDVGAPVAYATGFAHEVDVAGAFEAPDGQQALEGTAALEAAGWGALAQTEWLLGRREFAPVDTIPVERPWGFIALWRWNDAWQAASSAERQEYDARCDVAFQHDVEARARIAGRHRTDWASPWYHVGIWEAPSFAMLDEAMREHERVADFALTTSRHVIGRRAPLLDLLVEEADHA